MTDEATTLRTVESIARMEARIAELTARATAAEARVAELLSDRAEAAEALVTEVERAQTAERRAAELTAALREAWQERDAALAAVDAVRADYAPRREPPTADEVRAVSRLWGASNAPVLLQIPRGFVTANVSTGVRGSIVGWTEPDVRRVAAAESWLFLGPTGPVAWFKLAALVRGGDRG